MSGRLPVCAVCLSALHPVERNSSGLVSSWSGRGVLTLQSPWRGVEAWQAPLSPSEAKQFVEQCFHPFSGELKEQGVYKRLCQETANYVSQLRDKVSQREVKLYTGLSGDLQRRIKLPETDLKLTIVQTAQLLEGFYPKHVIPRLAVSEEQFWDDLDLEFRDWRGFAMKKLKDIFSPTFLVPLEQTDNFFQLKVNHINIQRYADMLATVDFHDDLDIVLELHTPEGDISVQAPTLDVQHFDPKKQQSSRAYRPASIGEAGCSRKGGGQTLSDFSKLLVPLPIPHPASIAVAIYNREHDQEPIDLQDPGCQRMVKATQEVPYLHLTGARLPRGARHHSQSPDTPDTPDTTDPHTPDTPYTPETSSAGHMTTTEPSTPASPDQASTESVTLTSAHLAVQEKSFSSDDGLSETVVGSLGSSLEVQEKRSARMGGGDHEEGRSKRLNVFKKSPVVGKDQGAQARLVERVGSHKHGGASDDGKDEGAQVLYYEVEKDTSCVLNMSDDGVPYGVPGPCRDQH
ncbi:hypothetical protein PoB_002488200 [Plakobranchus ocellatus]|uniref:Uncharacterized protein n=1 Tax=Plakobranchus ocellatus TaxID=259542 RepID=A0AAV3ZUZ9_9GAST|nr:hypothetical protein PoB_002488200 [Plakobranchus ocellatus]